jgi:hypothetical protein
MFRARLKRFVWFGLVSSAGLWYFLQGTSAGLAQGGNQTDTQKPGLDWRSPAKLRHIAGKETGNLAIGADGIQFKSAKRDAVKIPYLEVQTFILSPHFLAIETYQNRKRHVPGVERYKFELGEAVPPTVAAELAREVQRPTQNAIPDRTAQGIVIPAHHRTVGGGTNGILRFRNDGIDYVTGTANDSRSWRWADLQTLSASEPYHLLVFGFDLKEILPESLFYRMVDALDAHSAPQAGQGINTHPLESAGEKWIGSQQ